MKKYASPIGYALCFAQLKCPFCGATTVENPTMPWCASCQVEYYESRRPDPATGRRRFVFDSKRKTERFAWGKALNASGGMRIGKR
jgi:hypothetical protein